MKIGEASRVGGVSARSLRHYEDVGLIEPGRFSNGFRDYCQSTIDRVHVIRSLLESGLPVRLIREVLPYLADGPDVDVRVLPAQFLHEVESYRARLAVRIAIQTMRALVQQSHRGPKDLTLTTDRRRPVVGPGEYLIRVGAAGINFADVMQTHGTYAGGPQAPYVAGFEAAGEIVGVGPEIDSPLHLGTHVVGAGLGAFAQYMTMSAAGAIPVPSGWSEVLDSRDPDLAAEITRLTGGVDLVLESVGRATFGTSLAVVKPFTGRVVVLGAASGDAAVTTHDLVFTHHPQIKGLHIGALAAKAPSLYRSLLAEIEALIDHGVYPPGTPHLHALAEGAEALRQLEAGQTRGKHALDPWR
ncbi:MAG TPA: MerR family transcriptional regulator [Pseudonocardia sp.]